MVPSLLFDISEIDLDEVIIDAKDIEAVNPHRDVMRMIDGIIHVTDDYLHVVASRDVRDDEFWVPGHIPGRPIFPGVLMIEAAAQLASYLFLKRNDRGFMGFSAADDVKFRGQVVPGDRLILVGLVTEYRPRRAKCAVQGLVRGQMVFEGLITGMPM